MIARGFLLFQLKDAINLTTLIVEEYSSVGNGLDFDAADNRSRVKQIGRF